METSANVEKLIDQISQLTVLELAELVKKLEDKFGVSAAAPVAVAASPAAGAGAEAAPAEEKTEFSVMLTGIGDKKLQVIKEVRAIAGLGLKEAKDFVEGTLPKAVKENLPKAEAEEIKAKLEAVGASVEIK
ncbi:50S ribosomal protein L7/L12 [bacterium]|nr:MAG: 50S ribosomal protein L7/L12 [bacterium]